MPAKACRTGAFGADGDACAFTMGGSLYFYTFDDREHAEIPGSTRRTWTRSRSVSVMTLVLIVYMLFAVRCSNALIGREIGRRNNMILFGVTAIIGTVSRHRSPRWAASASSYTAFFLVLGGLVIASLYTAISGVVKADSLLNPTVSPRAGGWRNHLCGVRLNALFGGTAEYVCAVDEIGRGGGVVSLVRLDHGGAKSRLARAAVWMPEQTRPAQFPGWHGERPRLKVVPAPRRRAKIERQAGLAGLAQW